MGVARDVGVPSLVPQDWNFRTYTVCGNGVLDVGEACDEGAANGGESCCSTACTIEAAGTDCRDADGECDAADTCDGISAQCADTGVAAGVACTDDGNVCSDDECNGAGDCVHPAAPAGISCPDDGNVCTADACDGAGACAHSGTLVGLSCPDDGNVCTDDVCNEFGSCAHPPGEVGVACPDDGQVCTSDVCDASGACSHPAGHAGTLCRAPNGVCDAAEFCDGIYPFCLQDEDLPDNDFDGACDVIDPCTNTGTHDFVSRPKSNLTLSKINADVVPGNDKLKLSAAFALPAGAPFGGLTPDLTGIRLIVQVGDGSPVLDTVVPSGAYSTASKTGWKRSSSGKQWTYTDRSASPLSNIVKVTLTNRDTQKTPRQVRVTVTGAKGTYAVHAADVPLQAIVTLGDASAAAAGACGESGFVASDCLFNGSGTALTCKR